MLTSDTITKITPALIKAQAEFKPAVKDAVNPAFARGQNPRPSYVTLAQAIDSVSDALRANGIALIQQTDIQDARTVLVTRLIHESGEWIAGRYPVHPVKADPQGEGSALTYARRYALMALVGIAPEDDDGNAAVKAVQREPETVTRFTPMAGVWEGFTEKRAAEIRDIGATAKEYLDNDDIEGARAYLARAGLDGADEQSAAVDCLASYERAAMKKHREGDAAGALEHLIRNRKRAA